MSFGVSPGDVVMFLNWLWDMADILKGKARESFRQCVKAHEALLPLVTLMEETINNNTDLHANADIRKVLCDTRESLRKYHKWIEKFNPYLGKRSRLDWWQRFLAKFRWVKHAGTLERLRRDIQWQTTMLKMMIDVARLNRPIDILPGISSIPPDVPPPSRFILEDPRRMRRSVPFSDVGNWDNFQQLLTRLFSEQDRGHALIKHKSYVLRNTRADEYILPSSPGVKPLVDLIKPDDRVEIDVIIPYEDTDTEICPKCKHGRTHTSLVETTCHNCLLLVRFFHSFDDQPDPLTQLAMDDLRRSGLRKFVDDFIQELKQDSRVQPGVRDQELKEAVRANIKDTIEDTTSPSLPSLAPRQAIQHFDRAALCTPRWPSLRHRSDHKEADSRLRAVMIAVKRDLDHLKARPKSLLDSFARVIGWNTLDRTDTLCELLESYWSQYNRRPSPGDVPLECRVIHILDEIYGQDEQRSRYPFHPSTLRLRCLLWIYSGALTLDARTLSVCATTMKLLARGGFDNGRREPTLMPRALPLPFPPHLFTPRVVFDTHRDPLAFFSTSKPPSPILGVLFHLLRDSQEICLTYALDGNLENRRLELPSSPVFERGGLALGLLREEWAHSFRHCAELVVSSGRANLGAYSAAGSARWFQARFIAS